MFNVLATKRAKARQVPIIWTDDDGKEYCIHTTMPW